MAQRQVNPPCAMCAAVCSPAMGGLVGLSLLAVSETSGAQRPGGSETMSYPMCQKTTTTRTASPEIWLGPLFGGVSLPPPTTTFTTSSSFNGIEKSILPRDPHDDGDLCLHGTASSVGLTGTWQQRKQHKFSVPLTSQFWLQISAIWLLPTPEPPLEWRRASEIKPSPRNPWMWSHRLACGPWRVRSNASGSSNLAQGLSIGQQCCPREP